ncbi:MAG: prephenate dehydrogenase [Neisseria sp.]|nr:prephenate dehydrogenase [Neisseria sp.]
MYKIQHLTLIGVGLIGGSFVLDLKRLGLVKHVHGIDLNWENLDRALERKVIDSSSCQIDSEKIAQSDLIVIATPVATLPTICQQLADFVAPNAIISDVGSTKQSTLAAFKQFLPQHLARCVAAHPIAGSDRHGALAARFGLYQDKKLIICPHSEQDLNAVQTIEALWQAVGAQTYQMNAAEHDQIFAAVSHLPHLLAFAYVHQILEHPEGNTFLNFAASGFRDFTRIASSHPAIWTDICLANRDSLLNFIQGQREQLNRIEDLLRQQNSSDLYQYFAEAKQRRDDWLENQE